MNVLHESLVRNVAKFDSEVQFGSSYVEYNRYFTVTHPHIHKIILKNCPMIIYLRGRQDSVAYVWLPDMYGRDLYPVRFTDVCSYIFILNLMQKRIINNSL